MYVWIPPYYLGGPQDINHKSSSFFSLLQSCGSSMSSTKPLGSLGSLGSRRSRDSMPALKLNEDRRTEMFSNALWTLDWKILNYILCMCIYIYIYLRTPYAYHMCILCVCMYVYPMCICVYSGAESCGRMIG